MAFEGIFLRRENKGERKEAIDYEKDELRADLDVFTDIERPIVLNFINGESPSSVEAPILKAARNRWWEEKYGFPHNIKSARHEVLMRKYGPPEEENDALSLQNRMFETMATGDKDKIEEVKQEYFSKYPDQLEGIEVIFSIKNFLELARNIKEKKIIFRDEKERRSAYQNLTENHFLLTHFVKSNNKDKDFLNVFWSSLEKIASSSGYSSELNKIRKGTISQVATFRVFEELGLNPKMAHPSEDAFDKIDLWLESHPVQVKTTSQNLEFIDTEEIEGITSTKTLSFPAIETRSSSGTNLFNSQFFGEAEEFRAKIEEYGKATGKPDIQGYFVAMPYSKIDFVTGEPDKSLIKALGKKLPASASTAS